MAGLKIRCIKDVVMSETGEKAFTEGKVYNGYYYKGRFSMAPGRSILCAKNDMGERHYIKSPGAYNLDKFFSSHFVLVSKGE